ncbi:MAG: ribonucleoside-diphosphate reductase subunit alpha [Helicobacter sp.]|nr:ribonucleoside-diphosphate reductase subunit alpha [Helicobacter sp.]MBD5168009.1 ribonucleoside-diphosphate reductase subunit alpha [Helicobacter sp.]MDE6045566.1 ribonucleoside-diphosphate reductase subunit alpha [Helicobacter sp.]
MSGLKVIKRNGYTETLDICKIQKFTKEAVEGLNDVNQSELEVDARIQFRDRITTEEIQQTLIKTAADKIDIDRPDWTFVAARLFLYDLYHKVMHNVGKGDAAKYFATDKADYGHLRDYFAHGEACGRIIVGLAAKFDLDLLQSHIVPERDLQFTYLGIKTLYDRYLLKDKRNSPIELPQQMFMAIAMFLAQHETNRNEWAIAFYDMLSKFEVMAATPTLSNARTPRHQLSSCYVGSTPDNIEGIFDAYKEMALLSKYGGGIGWDYSKVRGLGSAIDGHKNAAGGVVPFLKITNDIAVAVDQLGTRKGAISVYLEVWHRDIFDFVDLKKNSGEERRRTHDLFPALWICDLFMERIEANAHWTLLDSNECGDLTELYGEAFTKRYLEYEARDDIFKEVVSAKDLWKKILGNYFETGAPFLCFKDNANRANPNAHNGIIRSSNLCTEIFQNTEPNHYRICVEFDDGTLKYFDENESVTTDSGIVKKANKLTSIDSLQGKSIFITRREGLEGKSAVCNLASINLSKVNTPEEIQRVVPIAVRMLDNVINLNFYPTRKVKRTNMQTRAIGLGVMGEAQMLAENHIQWGSKEHFEKIDLLMESISYHTILASSNLAVEKGSYPLFEGSHWSKGIFPIDVANAAAKQLVSRADLFTQLYDWQKLRKIVQEQGIRNGYLMAIAPTSSISILVGTTQTIEPIYKKKWFEENLSGLIPVVVPNLSVENWNFYASAYELDQNLLIKAAAIRQKWIDQGQSTNIFVTLDKASGKYLNDIYFNAWRLGLKSTYYLRSQSPEALENVEEASVDRSFECEGCQ